MHLHILVDSFLLFHSTRFIILYKCNGLSLESNFIFQLCKTGIYFCASHLASHNKNIFSPFLHVFFLYNISQHQHNDNRKLKTIHSTSLNVTVEKTQLDLKVAALGIRKWCVYSV